MALPTFENTSFSETKHLRKLLQGINFSEQQGFGVHVLKGNDATLIINVKTFKMNV